MDIQKTFWKTGKLSRRAAKGSRRSKVKGIADHRKRAIQTLIGR